MDSNVLNEFFEQFKSSIRRSEGTQDSMAADNTAKINTNSPKIGQAGIMRSKYGTQIQAKDIGKTARQSSHERYTQLLKEHFAVQKQKKNSPGKHLEAQFLTHSDLASVRPSKAEDILDCNEKEGKRFKLTFDLLSRECASMKPAIRDLSSPEYEEYSAASSLSKHIAMKPNQDLVLDERSLWNATKEVSYESVRRRFCETLNLNPEITAMSTGSSGNQELEIDPNLIAGEATLAMFRHSTDDYMFGKEDISISSNTNEFNKDGVRDENVHVDIQDWAQYDSRVDGEDESSRVCLDVTLVRSNSNLCAREYTPLKKIEHSKREFQSQEKDDIIETLKCRLLQKDEEIYSLTIELERLNHHNKAQDMTAKESLSI